MSTFVFAKRRESAASGYITRWVYKYQRYFDDDPVEITTEFNHRNLSREKQYIRFEWRFSDGIRRSQTIWVPKNYTDTDFERELEQHTYRVMQYYNHGHNKV